MKDLIAVIQHRYSSRTYSPAPLHNPGREVLVSMLTGESTGLFGEHLQFILVERPEGKYGKMRLDYGIINGHRNYIFAKIENTSKARINYGYLLEQVVLAATDLGLDSCWMGNFDREYFSDYPLSDVETVPAILIIGYAADRVPLKEKLVRLGVKAGKRKGWDELFFQGWIGNPLKPDAAGTYAEPLEMLRLAPSAGNTQPWRIIKEVQGNTFHFYKQVVNPSYESKGLHDVDLGICMSHFDVVARQLKLAGRWEHIYGRRENNENNLRYIASWVGE